MNLQAQKMFIIMTVAALLLLLSFYYLTHVWLIVFAAILTAIFLLSLVEYLTKTPWIGPHLKKLPHGLLLGTVVLGLIGILSAFAATFGMELKSQLEDLQSMVPKAIEYMHQYLKSYPTIYEWLSTREWARQFQADPQAFLAQFSDGAMAHLPTFLGGMVSGIGTFVVIMILGLFLAISPSIYRRSFVAMVPKDSRDKAEYLLDRSYRSIQQWLLGQLMVMSFVGVSTWLALKLMGIPFALALGFIAFLLGYIPVLGPWLSAVPIVLLTALVAPEMLVWVIVMIIVVQQLESYVVAPIVQNRMVDLPPVALLLSQVIMGSITGIMGVALAAPLMVIAIVWVQVLYIKFTLGDYAVRVLDQNDAQMQSDPFGDWETYQKKQAIESNPSLKMRLQMLRRRKLGQDAIDAAKKDNKL